MFELRYRLGVFPRFMKKCIKFCNDSKQLIDDIIYKIKNNQEVKSYEQT